MKSEIVEAFNQIVKDKNIDKELLSEILDVSAPGSYFAAWLPIRFHGLACLFGQIPDKRNLR